MEIKTKFFRKPSRNKYGAKKTVVGDIEFDSKKEAARWMDLQLLERAGEISDLKRQVKVELMGQYRPLYTRTGRKMKLTFDYSYIEDGCVIYEDCKGVWTRDFAVRIAVANAMGLTTRVT
jgi:hypothetical protein